VLTGGCFQNALLAERVLERLRPDFDVRLHGEVPPGDGGIALGQALVADAKLRESPCA
jgi:hydrogenase maturation protein HypF